MKMPPAVWSSEDIIDNQICDKCVEFKATKGSEHNFLKSVSVWVNKPHVVNRRLCGSKIVQVVRVNSQNEAIAAVKQFSWVPEKSEELAVNTEVSFGYSDLVDESFAFTVIIRELVPKSEFFPKLLEAVVYDKQAVTLSFIPIDQDCSGSNEDLKPTEELQYQIFLKKSDAKSDSLQSYNVGLSWTCDHSEAEMPRRQITSKWLRTALLEKLVNWSEINQISTSVTSLQLVPVDRYKDTYTRLKNTYGRDLVKNWTERTDPKKFVYEDVAIAAYLLLLWEDDRKIKNLPNKQSFVDLGCGNGLLVYILSKEGHRGLGIDLRKRNIWDTFGPEINLKEQAISPSSEHLFPDYDWIIGNHSDELTPWIPVIAARSSYKTCFFVLPCCQYDFVGKFGQAEGGKSRHESYLSFVRQVVAFSGFKPESDILRIPSTKRTCFIGRSRSYQQRDELTVDERRQAFIDKRTIYRNKFLKPETLSVPALKQNQTEPSKDLLGCELILSRQNSSLSSSSSDKRKYENLGSTDSGFYDDFSNSPGSKRSKDDCGSQESGYGSLESMESLGQEPHGGSQELDCGSQESMESLGQEPQQPSYGPTTNTSSLSTSPFSQSCDKLHTNATDFTNSTCLTLKSQKWAENFRPRMEPGVRNCQKVPENIKSDIVQIVFNLVINAAGSQVVSLNNAKTWRKGGSVPLSDLPAHIQEDAMKELKNECGGLQTLLRNHSHIFQVTGGCVQLRNFTSQDPWEGSNARKLKSKRGNKQQDMRKTTLCWFDAHHPDGCPRSKEDCSFAHGMQELRDKLIRSKIN